MASVFIFTVVLNLLWDKFSEVIPLQWLPFLPVSSTHKLYVEPFIMVTIYFMKLFILGDPFILPCFSLNQYIWRHNLEWTVVHRWEISHPVLLRCDGESPSTFMDFWFHKT